MSLETSDVKGETGGGWIDMRFLISDVFYKIAC